MRRSTGRLVVAKEAQQGLIQGETRQQGGYIPAVSCLSSAYSHVYRMGGSLPVCTLRTRWGWLRSCGHLWGLLGGSLFWAGLLLVWSEFMQVISSLAETLRVCCAGCLSRRGALFWLVLSSLILLWLLWFMPPLSLLQAEGTLRYAILREDNWAVLVLFAVLVGRLRR